MDAREFFGEWSEVIDFNILDGILNTLGTIIQSKEIAPAPEDLFKVFGCCPYSKLKAVFLGLDPYPQKGIATGVAFGNKKDTEFARYSPSLRVLYNAVEKYCSDDLPFSYIDDTFPTLERWCNQGLLLLNSALSVEIGKIGSHSALWKPFTESLLKNLQEKKPNTIFVFMGEVAQSFAHCVDSKNIIMCPHPSRCARTGEYFPNIFKDIDAMLMDRTGELIYWY